MAPRVSSSKPSSGVNQSSSSQQSDAPQTPNAPSQQARNSLLPNARSRAASNASDASRGSSVRTAPLPGQHGGMRRGPISLSARTQGLSLRSASESDLPRLLSDVGDPPADLPPTQSLIARSIKDAIDTVVAEGSDASSPVKSVRSEPIESKAAESAKPMTPEEAEAAIDQDLAKVEQIVKFLAELAPQLASAASSPASEDSRAHLPPLPGSSGSLVDRASVSSGSNDSRLHLPPLPGSTGSLVDRASVSTASEASSLSSLHLGELFDEARGAGSDRASSGASSPSEVSRVGMNDSDIELDRAGAEHTDAPAAAQKTAMDALVNWAGNVGHVGGHELVAVGVTTAIREVVAGLVQHLQNLHPGEGSQKAQEAAAGAIIGLVGLGNITAMLMRRSRGTNTATADAGNVMQIVGLISTAIGAGRTGNLKDLLPQLSRTVVYAGLRDTANTIKPYADNPQGGNALAAQLLNLAPYGANQFLVNWAQTAAGTSGAGFANKLDDISKMNATDAEAAKSKLGKELVLNGGAYVGANMLGEVFDKIAGSIFEQAVGEGWAGVPHMPIGHDPIHLPSGSEWGNAFEKTISRMSLFDQAISGSAWASTGITSAKFGEFGGTMRNNALDGSLVSLLCLPFVMTLMKKKLGGGSSGASTGSGTA